MFRQSDALEGAHGLVVQAYTTRVVDQHVTLFGDENPQPRAPRMFARVSPTGPAPHHEDVDGGRRRGGSFSSVGHVAPWLRCN